METYIAFLRAINVGGRTVKMERLREVLDELGLADVATFIASGNVIFRGPPGEGEALERRVEAQLNARLGLHSDTFIRTAAELAAIVAQRPFGAHDGAAVPAGDTLYVGFLGVAPAAAARERVAALQSEIDSFALHGRELYWWCRKTISQSPVTGNRLEKALGMPATLRNITTITRLAAKYPPDSP